MEGNRVLGKGRGGRTSSQSTIHQTEEEQYDSFNKAINQSVCLKWFAAACAACNHCSLFIFILLKVSRRASEVNCDPLHLHFIFYCTAKKILAPISLGMLTSFASPPGDQFTCAACVT